MRSSTRSESWLTRQDPHDGYRALWHHQCGEPQARARAGNRQGPRQDRAGGFSQWLRTLPRLGAGGRSRLAAKAIACRGLPANVANAVLVRPGKGSSSPVIVRGHGATPCDRLRGLLTRSLYHSASPGSIANVRGACSVGGVAPLLFEWLYRCRLGGAARN
jgi:hypothetical protein